ncbi:ESCRT-II complex subunit-domain-containing protein [Pyronema domesticum]|uniref:ESCRT-II complex subunit VPS25 n=1 Tax=Pyronema omphalodes (strain CBS 100304) TaxID=1076935 RepID=U4LAC9_PYROM|nr:ESCRT-II complex subunit-domain-containing protein [Pyronema domesticum]CCX07114.1 Similar to Vacuolar protein-sorting-associated protein 25; acc. no. Q9CQ80 [Pyronema omphalodes CBS 100304]
MADFQYPALYSFPPFFTRQPNATTWSTQQSAWSALILAYCERHRLFKFSVGHELFTNTELSRRLPTPAAIEVMEAMVKQGKAEWIGPEKQEILVYWKTPRDWANAVYDWIDTTGQKGGVLTLYEIAWGQLTASTEFHGLDETVLRRALDVLVERGVAKIFGSGDELGVKFF